MLKLSDLERNQAVPKGARGYTSIKEAHLRFVDVRRVVQFHIGSNFQNCFLQFLVRFFTGCVVTRTKRSWA